MRKLSMAAWMAAGMLFLAHPAVSYAHGDKDMAEHVAVMRQAADALKSSNPDLSKKLSDFADKKEKWKEDEGKHMEQKREDIGKIRQAADVLNAQNSGLAGDLKQIADRWEKKLNDKEKDKD